MELADGCWNMQKPVRALTVTAIYLIPEDQAAVQQTLFGDQGAEQRERLEKLAHAMDAIRDKYGKGAIGLASVPKEASRERHAPPPGGNREGEECRMQKCRMQNGRELRICAGSILIQWV